jgi:hypothetical protein
MRVPWRGGPASTIAIERSSGSKWISDSSHQVDVDVLLPRGAGVATYRDVEGPGGRKVQRAADSGDLVGRQLVVLGVGEDPVTRCGTGEHPRVARGAGHPDRDAVRFGPGARQVHRVVRACVAGGPARPHRAHHPEPLREHGRAGGGVRRLAEAAEVTGLVGPDPDADDEAPAGQPAHGGRVPRDHPGPASRERRDHRAEQHPVGGVGHRGEGGPRVGDRQRVGHDVVPQEHPVPPGGLRAHRQLDEDRRVTERAERRQVEPEADGVVHGSGVWPSRVAGPEFGLPPAGWLRSPRVRDLRWNGSGCTARSRSCSRSP